MAIGYLFARRTRRSLFIDILCGAAGGALGTFCLSQVFKLTSKLEPKQEQAPQEPQEPATEKLARKVLEPTGIHLEGDRKKKAGQVVHWGYGTVWGAIYGAMHGRVPYAGRLFGLGFGLGLFLLGDEVVVPALRLAPPPNKVPLPVHLSTLAAHLVYGSAAEASYRLFRRALA
jgi:hypothetical protein